MANFWRWQVPIHSAQPVPGMHTLPWRILLSELVRMGSIGTCRFEKKKSSQWRCGQNKEYTPWDRNMQKSPKDWQALVAVSPVETERTDKLEHQKPAKPSVCTILTRAVRCVTWTTTKGSVTATHRRWLQGYIHIWWNKGSLLDFPNICAEDCATHRLQLGLAFPLLLQWGNCEWMCESIALGNNWMWYPNS